MTPHPPTVTPEALLIGAARLLHDRRIRGLTVVEGGRVVGIIYVSALDRWFTESVSGAVVACGHHIRAAGIASRALRRGTSDLPR